MNLGLGGTLEVVGIDDGYFPPHFKGRGLRTILAAVYCLGTKPLDVRLSPVIVDFDDVDNIVINLVRSFKKRPHAILLDGVTYAGFNVVNPSRIHNDLGVPVIVIFKHDLDLKSIKLALQKHFNDWWRRYRVISSTYNSSVRISTKWRVLRLSTYGIDITNAVSLVLNLQLTSSIPEPLRLADIIASGLTRSRYLLDIINELNIVS